MPDGVVIIGGGQAGYQTAASLRSEGFDGRITLVGDEPHLPYQRPPLSKDYLLGKHRLEQLTLRPAHFYEHNRVDLISGDRAESIDAAARRVRLASGSHLSFDSLVLAVGARNRLLPVPGSELDGVRYLRTLDESGELRQRLEAATDVVVIGGGFIGLEAASVACRMGKHVTLIEALPRLMARAVGPLVSEYFHTSHAARGVEFRFNAVVARVLSGEDSRVSGVELADGTRLPADLVIAGIGVVPNLELAREAGLPLGNGIAVDEHLRTEDPRIFAIGDCADFPCAFAPGRVRLESVQNAVDQAVCVARTLVGKNAPYSAVPWFWSDQGDLHLQMAGLAHGVDQAVVRGQRDSGKFSVFYFSRGAVKAVDSVNRPLDHITARKLLADPNTLSPEQAEDEGFNLKGALYR